MAGFGDRSGGSTDSEEEDEDDEDDEEDDEEDGRVAQDELPGSSYPSPSPQHPGG